MSYQGSADGVYTKSKDDVCSAQLVGAGSLIGRDVYSQNGNYMGDIKEIMLNISSGKICYAVLFNAGFLGVGERLFAVPWQALQLDIDNKRYILNIDSRKLDSVPSFNNDNWPNMADETWANNVHSYYGTDMKRTSSHHSAM